VLRPLFTFVRYPSKLAAPAALLLALAGAVVIEQLLAQPRKIRNLCLVVAGLGLLGCTVGVFLQSMLARKAGAPAELIALAAGNLRADTLRVALLAMVGAAIFYFVERGRLSPVRAAPLLAALIFLDVFATTAQLSWTRAPVTLERPAFLPEGGPRGPRVMRLEEVTHTRLGLNEKASSDEQLRQAALVSPLANLPMHVSVLQPYGLYIGEVGRAMAEMVALNPVALAEVTATDVVLAAPGASAPWLVKAVGDGRLVLTATVPAGALAFRVSHTMPRSFLAGAATLVPHDEIPRRLAERPSRVLISAEKGLRDGAFAAASAIPASLLNGPASEPTAVFPTEWRPGSASYRISTAWPALLVEVDTFMPGWRAFVDGQEQPILQANLFGRAVVVPAGTHVVDWQFRPRLVVASLFMTWIALAFAMGALLLRRQGRT